MVLTRRAAGAGGKRVAPKVGAGPKAGRGGARMQSAGKPLRSGRRKLPASDDDASGVAHKRARKAVRQEPKASEPVSEAEEAAEANINPAAIPAAGGVAGVAGGEGSKQQLSRDSGSAAATYEPGSHRRESPDRHAVSQQLEGERGSSIGAHGAQLGRACHPLSDGHPGLGRLARFMRW